MKTSIIALSALFAIATAAPEAYGGWKKGENRKWENDKGKGWGYEKGKGWGYGKDWDKEKDCPKQDCPKSPIPYTSTYSVIATPDQVVNGTTPTGGQEGGIGYYDFGINSEYNLICYHIRLVGLGDATYQSLADTSTHIHEAVRGASGPPRIVFPNPQPIGDDRLSVGCISGPFKTGIVNATTGIDSGDGFHVSKIAANPAGFFADAHTNRAVPGAVRGQIA